MKRSARSVLLAFALIVAFVLTLKGSVLLISSNTWQATGTLSKARVGGSAALLPDGSVLVTGGDPGDGTGPQASVDVFNTDGTISAAAPMTHARSKHVSVMLQDGRILVAGGLTAEGNTTSTSELFDPVAKTWTTVGTGMKEARSGATAVLLQDGRVAIAGGQNGSTISSTVEIFDPNAGTFTVAGMMSSPRTQHAMTLLQDGRVLIVGGFDGTAPVATTDIFDPAAGTMGAGPALATARFGHSATTLQNGVVAVIGGNNGNAAPTQEDVTPAEMVDLTQATPAFTALAANLATPREGHLAILLPNNNSVLIVDGTSGGTAVASPELFSAHVSSTGVWTYRFAPADVPPGPNAYVPAVRSGSTGSANQVNTTSTMMVRNGVVAVVGGSDVNGNALNSTEAYGYPTVQTDQSDYPPGSLVTITGSGFQPGEPITIQLVESPLIDTHGPYTVQADASGNFVDTSFTTDQHDVDVRFYLSATGGTSGFVAQNTFTDSKNLTISFSGVGSGSVTGTGGYNCTDTAGAASGTCAESFNNNDQISLTATAKSGSAVATWTLSNVTISSGCTSGSTTCVVTMGTTAATVTVTMVVAGPANKLGFAQQPTNTQAGSAISPPITVQVEDTNGNLVNTSTASITVAIGANPGGGTLSGTTTASAVNGVATFSNLSINKTSASYTLTASSSGLTSAASNSFNITPGTASQLAFGTQPSTTTAGTAISPAVTVQIEDANGNVVTTNTSTVTIAISTGGAFSAGSTLSVAASSGVATFSNLVPTAAGSFTLSATDGTLTGGTSNSFTVNVGTATKLAFGTQPSTTTAGTPISPAVTVQLEDANGNVVTTSTASITVAIGTNPGGGTLIGTATVSAISGVATFSTLSINKAGTGYTLTANSTGLTGATSNTFNITAGTATQLAFGIQPSNTAAGSSITAAVTVQVEDANNNVVTTSTASVTVAIGTNAGGGTLSGTLTQTASAGVATFSNLSINKTGTGYTLTTSITGLTGATSNAFNITPGTASKVAFSQQPTNTQAGSSITPAVTVQVEDANNNLVTTSTASITVAIGTNLGGGTLSGTLTQTASGGVATFGGLSINKTGTGYTLTAASTGLTGGTSNTFNITPGAASKLAFNGQPSTTNAGSSITPAVTVQVQDANGNVVTTDSSSVSITISSPGAFSGTSTTTVSASSGVATFSNLIPTVVGTFTLSASNGSLTSATSNSFTVNAGALAKFVFATIGTQTVGTPFNVTITAEDANGNTVTSYTADGNNVTISSTGTLSGGTFTSQSFTNGLLVESVTITNAGNFTITANGNPGHASGINGMSNTFAVNQASTSTSVSSSANPSVFGQSVTFTATVTDGSIGSTGTIPSGETVTFKDGGTTIGIGLTNTSGMATFSTSTLPVASHSIAAVYGGDANFIGSASSTLTQTVNQATTSTSAAVSPNSITIGQSTTVTATVTPQISGTPTGTVSVSDGLGKTGDTCRIALSNGTGQCMLTPSSEGNLTVTATYNGDTNFKGSPGTASLTVTGTPPSITSGASATFTAGMPGLITVRTAGTPTPSLSDSGASLPGTFTFHDNDDGTATIAGTATVAGTTQFTITASNGVSPNATQLFSLAVVAGAITHLALNPATSSITAGQTQTYIAEGLDAFNNPAGDVTSATTFSIGSDGSCVSGSDPAPCTTTVADINGSNHTVTGTYMNSATGTASLRVNAASPTQLVVTSKAFTIIAGLCSGNITVTSQDQYGNSSNVSTDTQVDLSSASATGKFYSDAACQTAIPVNNNTTSVKISSGSSTQTFAYADTTPSPASSSPAFTTKITAADDATTLQTGTQNETILQLVFTTPSFTITQNACSGQITLTAENASGTPTDVTIAATLGLTSTSGSATFYSDNGCSNSIAQTGTPLASDVTIGSGASAVSFSYEDSAAGNPTITATIGAYSVSQQEQVGTPPKVTSNPSSQTVTYGSNATFTAAASGTPTPTVQWQVSTDGINWSNLSNGGVYSGATTTTLLVTLPPVLLSNTQYQAVFTNAVGSATTSAATLTVNTKLLMVLIVGGPTKPYDGGTMATLTSANFSISGTVGTDSFTVTQTVGSYASASAGMGITVTASLSAANFTPNGSTVANNYSFPNSASGSGTISPKSVTASITASNKYYDGTNAATITSCTIPGKVGSDDVACSVPAGDATFASSSASSSPQTVTATGITLTGTTMGDYALSSMTATTTATIKPAALVITASSAMMTYGNTPPMISAMYSLFVNGETAANLTTQPMCVTAATSASPVGSYMSSCSGAVDNNYTISYVAGTVMVNQATTTTNLTLSAGTINYGESTTVTATVVPQYSGTPAGMVTVSDGLGTAAGDSCTINLVGGTGTCSVTPSTAASSATTVTGAYNGDTNFKGSSGTTSLTVNPATTSTSISSPGNPSNFGDSITFTATVGDTSTGDTAVPTGGTVQFVIDGANSGSPVGLTSGTATSAPITSLASGQHVVTAIFAGETDFSGSISPFLIQTVNNKLTSISVTPGTPTIVVGQTQQFAAKGTFADSSSAILPPGAIWATRASMTNPVSASMAANGGNGLLYFFGGQDGSGAENFVQTYNPSSGAWGSASNSGFTARYQGVAVTPGNGLIYVIGGLSGGAPTTTVEAYNPQTDSWAAKASMSHPSACSVGGAINGLIYVLTGCHGSAGFSNEFDVYNPATDTWSSLTSPTQTHNSGTAGVINGKLYVAGGYQSANTPTNVVESYDPQTKMWTTMTPMPAALGQIAGAVVNQKLYVAGGLDSSNSEQSTVYVYDPSQEGSGPWSTLSSSLSQGRTNIGLVAFDGLLYAAGGNAASFTGLLEVVDTDSVTWSSNTMSIATVGLDTGFATGVTPGTANISASSAAYSVTGSTPLTVNQADTLTTVTSSPNPSTYGGQVTFSATVTVVAPGAGSPSGTVQFVVDGSNYGSPVALTSGCVSITDSALTAGSHSINAAYSGDSNFHATGTDSGSTATTAMQTVNKATPAFSNLTASQTITYGTPSITVSGKLTASTATPPNTDSVTVSINGTSAPQTVSLSSGMFTAMLNTSAIPASAPYTITYSFAGDSNFNTATDASTKLTVSPAPTTTTASAAAAVYGQPNIITLGATVTANSPSTALVNEGTVTFAVTSGMAMIGSVTSGTVSSGSASASFSVGGIPAGSYVITATYNPGTDFNTSSGTNMLTVTQASTTVTLTSSTNGTSIFLQSVTFTATVAPPAGYSGAPSGTVGFYDAVTGENCANAAGSYASTQIATAQTLITGSAAVTTATLTGALASSGGQQHNILACYSGDSNFLSSSGTTTQTVDAVPVITISPSSNSFTGQNVGTTSTPFSFTVGNIGDTTLDFAAGSPAIAGDDPTEFSIYTTGHPTPALCGSTLAAGSTCTIQVTFTPKDTGEASAVLQLTDNNEQTGSQTISQSVTLTGGGLSTLTSGGSLYNHAIFATQNACGSITMNGNSVVDSFNSATGYSVSHQPSGGNVGTNGNVTLNGNATIDGSAAVDYSTTGNCSKNALTGVSTSGGAKVTGGHVPLNGPISYPLPATPNPAPPTTNQSTSGSCGSISGCTSNGSKSVSLAPGQYGNLSASGGASIHLRTGTYNLNSLTLTGNSILYLDSGPVVINLAGASLNTSSPALDLSGGSIVNPTLKPSNLEFFYAGSHAANLSGGSQAYVTVYAPNAPITMSGGTDFFGAIIGSTVTNSGGTALHFDTNLTDVTSGQYLWFTIVVNNVQYNGKPLLNSAGQIKLYLTNSTISYTANGTPYTVSVPNAVVTLNSASATSPTTSYSLTNTRWSTSVPPSDLTGNTFVTGVAVPVPASGFPGGIQNVNWSAAFSTDTPNITLQWQWSAGVYGALNSCYAYQNTNSSGACYNSTTSSNVLNVNAEDGSADTNGTDPAGTPETYKQDEVIGFFSSAAGVTPAAAEMSAAPSNYAFAPQNHATSSPTVSVSVITNNDGVTHNFVTPMGEPGPIYVTGTNMTDFALQAGGLNNCMGITSLTAGSSCNLYVVFTPKTQTAESAKIVINSDANNSPQTVYLTGAGQ